MKYYITDPDTRQNLEIPDNVVDSVIKQYLDRKYLGVIGLGSFIIGFLLGVLAYAL